MMVRDVYGCEGPACSPETPLAEAGARMLQNDVASLPVVDRRGRVIGLLIDRDVTATLARSPRGEIEITVDDVMWDHTATCTPDEDLRDVLRRMVQDRLRRLPVVDDRGFLKGMLSIDAILCHAVMLEDPLELPSSEVIEAFSRIAKEEPSSLPGGSRDSFFRSPRHRSGRRGRGLRLRRISRRP